MANCIPSVCTPWEGTMSSRQVDLPLKVGVTDLNARLVSEQKIAGLAPDLWNQGLAKLGGLKDIVPTEDVISTKFKPVPTKP